MNKLTRNLNTVRVRLTLWYVALLAIIVLGFCLYLGVELEIGLSEQVDAGLQVAASQVLVHVDVGVNPPVLRPMSELVVDQLVQSRSAMRLVNANGQVIGEMGEFPFEIPVSPELHPFETIALDGVTWRIYTQQVITPTQELDTWLQVGQSLTDIHELQNNLRRFILIGIPVMLLVATLVGLFMAARALRPVDAITRTVQHINASEMTQRIDYSGTQDELGRLTVTLNSMLDRLQASFDLERRFTADASHELRTPLTSIKGQVDVALSRQRSVEEYAETLKQVQIETDRLTRLANDLLFMARLDSASTKMLTEQVNLSDLLSVVTDKISQSAETKKITVNGQISPSLQMTGNADHLIRLFLNILDNAIKYTPEGGLITVTAAREGTYLVVTIQDSGVGIAPEHLPYLFERFYRADIDRKYNGGTGLGLAIAHQIVIEHSGQVNVESIPGHGTTFIIRLLDSLPTQK